MPQITADEVEIAFKRMAKKKAANKSGIVAEMLQYGSANLRTLIAEVFSEILRLERPAPASWKASFVTVLLKKGDPQLPYNYRPVTLITAILYKLFARILYARVRATLESAQGVDQAGFRRSRACDDHLQSVTLLVEICSEFNCPRWLCTVVCQKAFDSVVHSSIWTALKAHGVDTRYVQILAQLY